MEDQFSHLTISALAAKATTWRAELSADLRDPPSEHGAVHIGEASALQRTPENGEGQAATRRRISYRFRGRQQSSFTRTGSDPVSPKRELASFPASNREIREERRRAIELDYTAAPAIVVDGRLLIPEGPLPTCVDAYTLRLALMEMSQGAALSTVKCVSAWRMGHIESKYFHDLLRSFAWQSAVLRDAFATVAADAASSSDSNGDECELLSEEDMEMLQAGGCTADKDGFQRFRSV
jgi:hypothetical protein